MFVILAGYDLNALTYSPDEDRFYALQTFTPQDMRLVILSPTGDIEQTRSMQGLHGVGDPGSAQLRWHKGELLLIAYDQETEAMAVQVVDPNNGDTREPAGCKRSS